MVPGTRTTQRCRRPRHPRRLPACGKSKPQLLLELPRSSRPSPSREPAACRATAPVSPLPAVGRCRTARRQVLPSRSRPLGKGAALSTRSWLHLIRGTSRTARRAVPDHVAQRHVREKPAGVNPLGRWHDGRRRGRVFRPAPYAAGVPSAVTGGSTRTSPSLVRSRRRAGPR